MCINIRHSFYLFLGLLSFMATPVIAADNVFLCSDSLEGESLDERYQGCIEILAWSWGASVAIDQTGSGSGAGRSIFQEVNITKLVDKSSVTLAAYLPALHVIPTLDIFVDNCTSECSNSAYYKLTLENVLVSAVSIAGSAGGGKATEQLSLNYAKINWCYSVIDPKGQLGTPECAGWNIVTNTPTP